MSFQKSRGKIFFFLCAFLAIVFFQNCGQHGFQSRLPSSLKQTDANQNAELNLPSEDVGDVDLSGIKDIPSTQQIEDISAVNSSAIIASISTTSLISTAPNPGKKIYYVATSGNDGNPGTITKPFRTLARGSRAMASGDTLYVRAGTYSEFGPALRNGTASAYTRYVAYPREERKVIIKPPLTSGNLNVVYFPDNAEYIEFRGFVVDGINVERGYGIKGIKKSRVINNVVRNAGMGLGGGRESLIVGNEVYNMSDYGIYTGSGDNGVVEGNIFHHCGGFGIHHYKSGGGVNNWTFRNNVIYRTGRLYYHYLTGDKIRTSPAVIISSGRYNKFYNNIIYDNHGGISVAYGAVDSLIANNTVYANDTTGINVSGANSGSLRARIVNNIVFANKGTTITNTGTSTTIQNNLTVDPKFVSASSRNFRLQAGSPAIDKGLKLLEVPKDFLNVTRPRGKAYDIGAYEY